MKRWLMTVVLVSGAALAQQDASIPDASVGMGGADQTSEENDQGGPCLSTRDCDRTFTCSAGRCVPSPVRSASGCGGGALAVLPMSLGVLLLLKRR